MRPTISTRSCTSCFFLMIRRPTSFTLFPYTTLFRSAIETDGVFTPLITVRDSSPVLQAVAQRYTILEKPRDAALPPMLLPSGKLHRGTAGVRYAEALLAGGGKPPLVWSLTAGALPPGLSLDASRSEEHRVGKEGRSTW